MSLLRFATLATLSLAALATTAPLATAKPPSPKQIAEWLPLLPTEVFDNTTEGIEAEELETLRKTGTSENWKAKRVSATKYLATAKRPFSEVHMTLQQRGALTYLQVLTFNEKAVAYSYWQPAGDGEPLTPYQPGLAFRALNETGETRTAPKDPAVPADITQHLARLEACHGVAEALKGEVPAARREALQAEGKTHQCDSAMTAHATISQRYAGKAPWPGVLERAGRILQP